ncbi:membrane protease YdiL (CAAX protease family) [Bacillus sp. SLBN-46]|uniref:CPBP family intramembrane glutamic endopeptidase n=1 Tax=Bacillus sp. SLBN-46 TaxID=3042283 RepID=UPI0028669965|nr:CPBP family intramembrane glutamic endopeptidase [Bacillus sp. SLBN-46]MDR6122988.1 membrane protease YdiL (CAAX protease family) [Bacillus sp. SLBN-46]
MYFNLIPVQLGNPYLQFGSTLLFFPLAFYISKWVGLDGLKGLGMVFHPGWKKNFFISFLIGFGFWMVMFGIQFYVGDLEFVGVHGPVNVIMPVVEVFVGYLVGSLINDLIVRGYVVNILKDKIHIVWVFIISILIYALDDYWYAGFSISNSIFSIILGLSLTLAYYKTGSIWADTGLHYGLNIAYGLFYGLVGNSGSALFIVKETGHETAFSNLLNYIIPALMFIFVLWALKYYSSSNTLSKDNKITFSH